MKSKILKIIFCIVIVIIAIMVTIKINKKTQEENSIERVLNKGTFILGLDDSFPPMGFRNEDNEIVGFDIDVAKEVCNKLGVELILQPISWSAKEQELNSYKIDCIWNGMSINQERQEQMSLSFPYLENQMSFLVKKDNQINTLEDLKDKKVGVQSGSSAEEILQNSKIYSGIAEVISYEENLTAFMDLEINQIDCVFVDSIVANYYISSNNKEYKLLPESLADEEYAIGFRKSDQELCNKINEILSELKKDGTLEKISIKWFGKDITTIK